MEGAAIDLRKHGVENRNLLPNKGMKLTCAGATVHLSAWQEHEWPNVSFIW